MADKNKADADTLSTDDFRRFSVFVYDYCGIVIDESRRTLLEARLHRRMKACAITTVAEYWRLLTSQNRLESEEERIRFIDAITINKTDFFRETAHFDLLENRLLDLLYKDDRNNAPRPIKIWSAACAAGAEAYSLAMVLHGYCQTHPNTDYFVLGTDISQTMIAKATYGCFPLTMLPPIPTDMRRLHLLKPKNEKRHEFRVAPHLRQKTAFARLNLIAKHYPIATDYDIIFCRNALIYFDKTTQAAVLRRLSGHLRDGGFLIIGHSETATGMDIPLVFFANTVFRKVMP